MSYDPSGNTLSDGTNTYTWDARNRLVSANNGIATFVYDPYYPTNNVQTITNAVNSGNGQNLGSMSANYGYGSGAVVMHPVRCHAKSVPGTELDGKCGRSGLRGNSPSCLFSMFC
jgi:uncharacterized protein RhaS with RHS repeats